MYRVDVYLRVRRAVMVDGMSLRGADPGPGSGGGDGTGSRGSCKISAQSNDTGGRADRDPGTQCRDHGVTSKHPDPGDPVRPDNGP